MRDDPVQKQQSDADGNGKLCPQAVVRGRREQTQKTALDCPPVPESYLADVHCINAQAGALLLKAQACAHVLDVDVKCTLNDSPKHKAVGWLSIFRRLPLGTLK